VRPPDLDDYATDRLVGDVLDLLDVVGVERVHLVGHDWGGQVAWLTAAHHPDRVETLTVLSRPHPAAFARSFGVDPDQAARSGHHRSIGPETTDEWWADGCATLHRMLDRAGVPEADANAYLEVFAERDALDAALMWYRAAARTGGLRAADCPAVVVPTRYLWGTADQSVGRVAAELTAEHVTADYRFVQFDGAGHFLTDGPDARVVVGEILDHVSAHR
jgi:pimeloyl-ACP methyl ester carboxylesterase